MFMQDIDERLVEGEGLLVSGAINKSRYRKRNNDAIEPPYLGLSPR